MMIQSSTKTVYDTSNLHDVVFVKNLLEYSDDYARSVGNYSLWYLDTEDSTANTNTGFEARKLLTEQIGGGDANAKDVNVIIPLNIYSFFRRIIG